MRREDQADEEQREPGTVPAQIVAEQIVRARGRVFHAYVRARERARELADAPAPPDEDERSRS